MQLRNYQESISTDAAKMLEWLKICYLSMEVRTGKTTTALAAADKYGAKWVLFLTKKKAISSIVSDYDNLAPSFKLICTNYEQVYNLSPDYKFDLVILDEAHGLGQFPTPAERTRELKKICVDKPIIYLSGTPTPEGYSQLYHQFYISSFSPFKEYKNFYSWAKEFVTVKKKYFYNREINDYSHADKDKIEALTKPYFISYTQEEAGFEQLVKEEVLKVQMQPGTYRLAEYLRKHRVYVGKDGQEVLADTEVKLMNKMHQIFSGTVITEKKDGIVFDNSKAKFIKEHFAGKKIGIFYKFTAERIMLTWAYGIDRLTEDPAEFNERDDKTFFSQIQSGREGVNLSTADCLVFLNIDYAAVSYWQARARLQSKDRVKEAVIYWVFADGGIEEKIYKAVMDKKDYTLAYFKKDYQIKKEAVK
jgi:superfamily II DNA or RNA helicase